MAEKVVGLNSTSCVLERFLTQDDNPVPEKQRTVVIHPFSADAAVQDAINRSIVRPVSAISVIDQNKHVPCLLKLVANAIFRNERVLIVGSPALSERLNRTLSLANYPFNLTMIGGRAKEPDAFERPPAPCTSEEAGEKAAQLTQALNQLMLLRESAQLDPSMQKLLAQYRQFVTANRETLMRLTGPLFNQTYMPEDIHQTYCFLQNARRNGMPITPHALHAWGSTGKMPVQFRLKANFAALSEEQQLAALRWAWFKAAIAAVTDDPEARRTIVNRSYELLNYAGHKQRRQGEVPTVMFADSPYFEETIPDR